MSLTAEIINKNKPKEKRYTLSDGRGLLLVVHPTGKKSWIVRYFVNNKEHRKHIGEFPTIDVKEAREITARIKGQALRGDLINPNPSEKITFKKIAEEWFAVKIKSVRSAVYVQKTEFRLNKHLIPAIGHLQMSEVKASKILEICRAIEARGHTETARRIKRIAGAVFNYAIASDRAKNNPTSALSGALTPPTVKHYATITDEEGIANLIKKIDKYPKQITRIALMFSALTFCRPGEIRHAEWSEIDYKAKEWQIPAEKMKKRRPHVVPLSRQLLELLEELKGLTGGGRWLFPSERRDGRPMSENTVRVALRLLEYSNEQMTAHGFRAMASTTLNRHKYNSDYIEVQLSHIEKNTSRAPYNYYDFIDERREMMQHYADYLWELMNEYSKKGEELAELLKSDEERRWDNDNLLTEEELYIKYNPPSEDEED